jgi:hypothetical protein
MLKKKWIIGLIALDGLVIIALTIYLFFNFSSINLAKGIVFLIVAGIVLLSVIGMMIYLTRSLAPKKTTDKNTPQKS